MRVPLKLEVEKAISKISEVLLELVAVHIFDHQHLCAHPSGLSQHLLGLWSMVQYRQQQGRIEFLVSKGELGTIGQYRLKLRVNGLIPYINWSGLKTLPPHLLGNGAIARANVEHPVLST